MNISERFEGCVLGGAIGDAFGSAYENQEFYPTDAKVFYPLFKPIASSKPKWNITDDTQLTLATLEAIIEKKAVVPESISMKFVELYKARRITGIGASTL